MASSTTYSSAKDAKDLLDRIGEDVYKKVKDDANVFRDYLKGNLASATEGSSETVETINPCRLNYTKRLGGNGERHPCRKDGTGKEKVNRFSDTLGGQCTDHRIKGNKNNCGACAPLRRLHLCHHNLESIQTKNYNSSNARHKLLAEVCYAAKHEGDSIRGDYAKYHEDNPDFKTHICTELARSFADIGDIVRGKDLYRGYDDEEKNRRKKLQQNLKEIFGDIYDNLVIEKPQAEARYRQDSPNFYKLREDWWTANRATIWEAITCEVKSGSQYFRATCGGGQNRTATNHNCRCSDNPNTDPPTYFDYVPEFLRWFEEWAEDFCRKRKHKLENAINKCRRENGKDKYCSGNGYDCTQTIRGDLHFVEGDCHDCSVACSPFVKWLDNQKLEFDKQKNKYAEEIKKAEAEEETSSKGRKRRSTKSETYEGYDKDFYNILKGDYKGVDKFLKILNKEGICKEQPKVKGETADSIDFKNENTGKTFSRTEICEPCPWCGAQKGEDGKGKWEAKGHETCGEGKGYLGYRKTDIPILTGDKTKGDMVQKYKTFCASVNGKNGAPATPPAAKDGEGSARGAASNSDNATTGYCGGTNNSDSSLCEPWTCYYYKKIGKDDSKKDINFCVLQKEKQEEKDKTFSSYNAFFWKWVHDMLIDSIKWRNELGSCIDNAKSEQCKNKQCRKNCDCFKKWVEEKKKEWGQIKVHFDTQDFGNEGEFLGSLFSCPSYVLKTVLKLEDLFENIKSGYGNVKELKGIENMLEKEKKNKEEEEGGGGGGAHAAFAGSCNQGPVAGQETTIDKLLDHEKGEAQNCVTNNPDKCEKNPTDKYAGRIDIGPPAATDHSETHDSEEEEEEEEGEEEGGEVGGSDGGHDGDDDDYHWYVGPLYHIRLPMNSD